MRGDHNASFPLRTCTSTRSEQRSISYDLSGSQFFEIENTKT